MSHSVPNDEKVDTSRLGIPLRYVEHHGATTTTVGELLELAAKEQHLRSALERAGAQLGHAIGVEHGMILYLVCRQTSEDSTGHKGKSLKATIRDYVVKANLRPAIDNTSSLSEGVPPSPHDRLDIAHGPRHVWINGKKIPFAAGLDARPDNAPNETVTTIRITGRERHYIDARGNRYRAERGDDGQLTGDIDATLHVVRVEKVLLSEPEQLMLQLDNQQISED